MGTCVSQIESNDEESFKFTQFGDNCENGEERKPRKCTDMFFFYFMAIFFLIVSGFLIYCATVGDINRILHGYDDCGNICGKSNMIDYNGNNDKCIGLDMTKKPYLLLQSDDYHVAVTTKKCVENCEQLGYDEYFGRCVPKNGISLENKNLWQMMSEDINANAIELIYVSIISFALVTLLALLLRYNTEAFIWSVLVGGSIAMILGVIALWIAATTTDDFNKNGTYLSFAISFTIITSVMLIYMCCIRTRIKMVIQLFKEAAKAIGAIPLILFEPILTILALGILSVVGIYFMILIGSAGTLTYISDNHYDYLPNDVVIAAAIFLIALMVWYVYFFIGCQHMIVGGAIASWYFIRDKSRLKSPVYYATYNCVRYHLGSVAFGSIIMLIMQIVKGIIEGMRRKLGRNGCGIFMACCGFVFELLENLIQYFSKLSYIMTAMHGVPFCRGGKEAMRLLLNNGLKVIIVNTVRNFILFFVHMIVIVATCLISFQIMNKPGLHSVFYPVFLSAVIAGFMSYSLLTVYNTAIDTIFLCFCEDMEQNDGIAKPYYMSQELMLFVENQKKVLWDTEPQQVTAQNNRDPACAPAQIA